MSHLTKFELGPKNCNHLQCDGSPYCFVEHCFNTHIDNQSKLECNVQGNIWNRGVWVNNPITLQFCGIQLTLKPDGTYELCDTSIV